MNIRPRLRLGALLTSSMILIAGCSGAAHGEAQAAQWTSEAIVSDAIIGYLAVRQEVQAVAADSDFYSQTMRLLLLFDQWDSEGSMKAAVDLGSFYLGAHGGEVLSCVIVRKGKKIRPILAEAAGSNACHTRLGAESPVCLPQKEYESFLLTAREDIESGESCEIEP